MKSKELRNFNDYLKMNKIINKFLLTGSIFMPELRFKDNIWAADLAE